MSTCPLVCSSLGTRIWLTEPRCTTTSTRSSRCSPWRSESPHRLMLIFPVISVYLSCTPGLICLPAPLPSCIILLEYLMCLHMCCVFVCPLQAQGRAKSSWLRSIDRWGEWGWRFHCVWVSWTGTSENIFDYHSWYCKTVCSCQNNNKTTQKRHKK